MGELQYSPTLVASADFYVGGLNWTKGHGLQQAIIGLSEDEAIVLGGAGRLDRVAAAGGQKARPTILPAGGQGGPRLLLTGSDTALQAMKDEVARIFGADGRAVPIHPHDTAVLRKPTRGFMAELEAQSGCRFVVEDQQKLRLADPVTTPRRHCVRLFGDTESQARALGLLAPRLQHSDTPLKDRTLTSDYANACEDWLTWKNSPGSEHGALEGFFRRMPNAVQHPTMSGSHPLHDRNAQASENSAGGFFSFDPAIMGDGLELPRAYMEGTLVRQRFVNTQREKAPLQGLVVAGKGTILPYMMGSFFVIKVLKIDTDRKSRGGVKVGVPRGGTRIGVTTVQPEAPAPPTLLNKPRQSWVLGRGFVRGPDRKTARCDVADFDKEVTEGDELGVLVTRAEGAVVIFRRPDRYADWTCMVHWDAGVDEPSRCFALLELSGAILEVELLQGRQPPPSVEREIDEVVPPKRLWP